MRRTALIIAVLLVVAAGAVWGARSWMRVRAQKSQVQALVDRGAELCRTEQGLSPAAVEFKKALELEPDNVLALWGLGDVEWRLKQYPEAAGHLRRAADLAEPDQRPAVQLALGRALTDVYRGSGSEADFRSAHNAFLEARQDRATEPEALEGYGALFLAKGRNFNLEKALSTFEELLKKYPDHPASEKVRPLVTDLRAAPAKGG